MGMFGTRAQIGINNVLVGSPLTGVALAKRAKTCQEFYWAGE